MPTGPQDPGPSASHAAALAPSGVLRVALNHANSLLVRAPAPDARGVAADLGRALAARHGLPVCFVGFDNAGLVADAVARDAWDVAFIGADAAREGEIWFSRPYVGIEATYLVPSDSAIRLVDEVDRAGIRIAVADRSAYHLELQRIIRYATLVTAPSIPASVTRFVDDGLEVLAGLRPHLLDVAAAHPGHRVLDGAFMMVRQAVGVPRQRAAAAAVVAAFVDEVLTSGLVTSLVTKHDVRGLTVLGASL